MINDVLAEGQCETAEDLNGNVRWRSGSSRVYPLKMNQGRR